MCPGHSYIARCRKCAALLRALLVEPGSALPPVRCHIAALLRALLVEPGSALPPARCHTAALLRALQIGALQEEYTRLKAVRAQVQALQAEVARVQKEVEEVSGTLCTLVCVRMCTCACARARLSVYAIHARGRRHIIMGCCALPRSTPCDRGKQVSSLCPCPWPVTYAGTLSLCARPQVNRLAHPPVCALASRAPARKSTLPLHTQPQATHLHTPFHTLLFVHSRAERPLA